MPFIFRYIILSILGILIILLFSVFQKVAIPIEQKDFSHFLNYNFTKVVACFFVIAGFLVGYFSKLNPWFTGLSLFIIFPLSSLTEAIVIKGSHNLIPLELVMFFFYSLPTIFAVYAGRFFFGIIKYRNARHENKAKR